MCTTYYSNGSKHTECIQIDEDKSIRMTYYETGNLKKKEYFYNEICHNTDGPAIIKYYPNKIIKSVKYLLEGFYYRENNEPALQSFYENGSLKCQKWFSYSFDGMSYLHSIDSNPAIIKYFSNGNIKTQKYFNNGILHNENGPAVIDFYENNTIKSEKYYLKNLLFSINDFPSVIDYYPDGKIKSKKYHINGILMRGNNEPCVINYKIKKDYIIKEEEYCRYKLTNKKNLKLTNKKIKYTYLKC
jgi:antitoxin component YwqK of YwqJK toxin-antitoxin module